MTAEPELKEAVLDVIENIDNDLDQFEDIISEATEDAIERLNKVLVGKEDEPEPEQDEILSRENLLNDEEENQS